MGLNVLKNKKISLLNKNSTLEMDELKSKLDKDAYLTYLSETSDNRRIKDILTDASNSDEIFLESLKLYSWQQKDFFESEENRDVSAALISRFYKNSEQDDKLKYTTMGIMHLIAQSKQSDVIETIASLEPIQKHLKITQGEDYNILAVMATHHLTPKHVLETFIRESNSYIRTLIAMRQECDKSLHSSLYENGDEVVLEALSHNPNLDNKIAIKLIFEEKYARNIAKHIKLDSDLFEILVDIYPLELSKNDSIDFEMQQRLFNMNDAEVNASLAVNINIDEYIAAELLYSSNDDISYAM